MNNKEDLINYDFVIKSYLPVFTGFKNSIFSLKEEDTIRTHNAWLKEPVEKERFVFNLLNYEINVGTRATEFVEDELEYWLGLEDDSLLLEMDFSHVEHSLDYKRFNDKVIVEYKFQQDVFDTIREFVETNYASFQAFISDLYEKEKDFWKIDYTLSELLSRWEEDYELMFSVTEYGLGMILSFFLKEKKYLESDLYKQLIPIMSEVEYEVLQKE